MSAPWDPWARSASENRASPPPQQGLAEEDDPDSEWAKWNRVVQSQPPSAALGFGESYMQHSSSSQAADSWDQTQGDYGWQDDFFDPEDEFNAPVMGQDDAGKIHVLEDKPPEWNGEDPLHQAETYINRLRMWRKTTRHDENKQAKLVADRMKGKLAGLISEMYDPDEKREYPLFKDGALDEILKKIEQEYKDYLDFPCRFAGTS